MALFALFARVASPLLLAALFAPEALGTATTCTAVLNCGERDCCPSTGLCQSSSCTVFGFANSARSNCHTSGANPNCVGSVCQWVNPNCVAKGNNHCYGTIVCGDSSTTCDGYGKLCLDDGGSSNFKICSDALDSSSGNSTTATPGQSNNGGGPTCDALEHQVPSNYLEFDSSALPGCSIENALQLMQSAGCVRPNGDCDFLRCDAPLSLAILAQLRAMKC